MKKNHAKIDGITVSSNYKFVVYGSVRTLVSEHRTLRGAQISLEEDMKGCQKSRGYSDAAIYEWADKWVKTSYGIAAEKACAEKKAAIDAEEDLAFAKAKGFNSYSDYVKYCNENCGD